LNRPHGESIGNKVIRYLNDMDDGAMKDKFEDEAAPSLSRQNQEVINSELGTI